MKTLMDPKLAKSPWRYVAAIFLVIVVGRAVFNAVSIGPRGSPATRSDLVGTWLHRGSNVTVELTLADNDRYTCVPGQYLASSAGGIPFKSDGVWSLNPDGILVFVGGNSFHPYRNGDKLQLVDQMNGSTYIFYRKPAG